MPSIDHDLARWRRYRGIAKELMDKTAGYPKSHLDHAIRTRAEELAKEDVKPYVALAKQLGHQWMNVDSGMVVGHILNAQQRIHERELRAAVEAVQEDLEIEAELDAETSGPK
jgi:hypothetical protein